jgi:hypothetical protein
MPLMIDTKLEACVGPSVISVTEVSLILKIIN